MTPSPEPAEGDAAAAFGARPDGGRAALTTPVHSLPPATTPQCLCDAACTASTRPARLSRAGAGDLPARDVGAAHGTSSMPFPVERAPHRGFEQLRKQAPQRIRALKRPIASQQKISAAL